MTLTVPDRVFARLNYETDQSPEGLDGIPASLRPEGSRVVRVDVVLHPDAPRQTPLVTVLHRRSDASGSWNIYLWAQQPGWLYAILEDAMPRLARMLEEQRNEEQRRRHLAYEGETVQWPAQVQP